MPKKTKLFSLYQKNGPVKTTDFAGWEMPLQFSAGAVTEHMAVRSHAGFFDVSHMGEFLISGKDAGRYLNLVVTNDISTLEPGQAQYNIMCGPDGTAIDDLLVYYIEKDRYMVVVNASNSEKDFLWINQENPHRFNLTEVQCEDISDNITLIALQGPAAFEVLSLMVDKSVIENINQLKGYRFIDNVDVAGKNVLLSRTGYTGEDGFELYCMGNDGISIWQELQLIARKNNSLLPCGLAARDSLRLEACLPLYGHEMDDATTPLEAGLSRFVKLEKEDFVGKKALEKQKSNGLQRKTVALEMIDPAVPRQGQNIVLAGKSIGMVTSGGKSPVTNKFIALGQINANSASIGDKVQLLVRGKTKEAKIVKKPFVKKNYAKKP